MAAEEWGGVGSARPMETTANPSAPDPASYSARPRADDGTGGGAEEGRCVADRRPCNAPLELILRAVGWG